MSERVLITGGNGYIGNALVSQLRMRGKHEIMSIDSGMRKQWVAEVGGASLTYYNEEPFLHCNVASKNDIFNVLNYFRPTVILHLASQPSAPYSEQSLDHRLWTQNNNSNMLVTLLGCVNEMGLGSRIVVTTTTGTPGAADEVIKEDHMPNMAGSSYHVSRGFDSANLYLAARQWKMRILELRTAITYGLRGAPTVLSAETRFDWDKYFGTALHRFILSKKLGKPITIYGKGEQVKPFISLVDVVDSLAHSITAEIPIGHTIMNQMTELVSIVDLAERVGGDVVHIPNPRVEKEDHKMRMANDKFLQLLGRKPILMADELAHTENSINLELLPPHWEKVF